MEYSHVRPDVRDLLGLSIKDRMALMHRDLWINNPTTESVFRAINNISEIPSRLNAPALLVTGAGGSGKSALIDQIPKRVKNSDGLIFVTMAEDPEICAKKDLREELSKALGIPVAKKISRNDTGLPRGMIEVIRLRKVWGVVIDEMHDALLRPKQEQRMNMSVLKRLLSKEYGLCLFVFGTVMAKHALHSNEEFKRRFYEIELEDWKEDEAFRSFLLEVEESLPLRTASKLYSEEMVHQILVSTTGRMDKILELIKSAACYALKEGVEYIDIDFLRRAARDPWGY
ncbi:MULTISPECIES: TniB family NTP-binding protein [Pseudomonas]|uniref:TniB family NTP-binding protein n=1 Tax=Pseudomonas nitroreducens TaxID=46680 RepID=UPI001E3281C9|nr:MULTISPECIES: TniB family NTP-binding protein [Pseudomonas]MCE4072373.1 TniB family NTP-binding protein [Pseudomonas nitritireducens]MCE4081762.1 TniB family NTP-binding protein [Pseudomonas nitroreducens]